MLLVTSADRVFGVGAPGKLTAREALAVATSSKVATLTADGFEVLPEFLPDVWALARLERSVAPVGVVEVSPPIASAPVPSVTGVTPKGGVEPHQHPTRAVQAEQQLPIEPTAGQLALFEVR